MFLTLIVFYPWLCVLICLICCYIVLLWLAELNSNREWLNWVLIFRLMGWFLFYDDGAKINELCGRCWRCVAYMFFCVFWADCLVFFFSEDEAIQLSFKMFSLRNAKHYIGMYYFGVFSFFLVSLFIQRRSVVLQMLGGSLLRVAELSSSRDI